MPAKTISSTYASGIILTNTAENPLTITSTALITNASGAALQSSQNFYWTIDNTGIIQAAGTTSSSGGILLAAGASVINQSSGLIQGYANGVSLAGAGVLVNKGTIAATQTLGSGYSYNATTKVLTPINGGVVLGGGSMTNAATGRISAVQEAVAMSGGGTVVNDGFINGSGTVAGFGVVLTAGGAVLNNAGGTIDGGRFGILTVGTSAASVANAGTIDIKGTTAIRMISGGSLTNAATGMIAGTRYGLVASGASASTVTNAGLLTGTASTGVRLNVGGVVDNALGGSINGLLYGVLISGGTGSVVNAGTIQSSKAFTGLSGFNAAGVDLSAGGSVTNAASGHINGKWIGVQIGNRTASIGGSLVNQGSIFSSDGTNGAAVWIHGPAYIDNRAGATISGGPYGIVAYADTTLVNRGNIIGTQFAFDPVNQGFAQKILVAPGASFTGLVKGGNSLTSTVVSTLELMSGASTGTLSGFGTQFTEFRQVVIDAGASWSFGGTVQALQTLAFGGTGASLSLTAPRSMAGTITGFTGGDTISLAGINDITGVNLGLNNLLTLTESAGPGVTLQLDPSQNFSGLSFSYGLNGGATNLTVACFAAGTRIETEQGLLPVEDLATGMCVRTVFSGMAEITWAGRRHIDCRRHPKPELVWPVRIRANAFGPTQPSRDIDLSPDHAVFVNGVLIPVRHLINGTTIRQRPVDAITYHHVALASHDVLLAEGLPAESYLETGGDTVFDGKGAPVALFPDFVARSWEMTGCAPLVVTGPELEAVRALLRDHARSTAAWDEAESQRVA